jgi:hypothetical protein
MEARSTPLPNHKQHRKTGLIGFAAGQTSLPSTASRAQGIKGLKPFGGCIAYLPNHKQHRKRLAKSRYSGIESRKFKGRWGHTHFGGIRHDN